MDLGLYAVTLCLLHFYISLLSQLDHNCNAICKDACNLPGDLFVCLQRFLFNFQLSNCSTYTKFKAF